MDHKSLLGKRIELPVHYNAWMRGARFGTVTVFRRSPFGQGSDCVLVKMDNPGIKRRVKLWRGDWEYAKIVD